MTDHHARIFLLSHMRAYTSLAGHILGSHPRINGYFELHISYEDAASLVKQLEVYQRYETLKPGSSYLFDKLLHNDYLLNSDMLGAIDSRILVSLLEPDHAIRSIVDLFQHKGTAEPYAEPVSAATYYMERLRWLADFCRLHRRAYRYYDAELFQSAPERLLGKLTDWLALDSPLSEDYQIFSQTGKSGKGDSSPLIRSGRIEQARKDYSHIQIPVDLLQQAQEVYRECRTLIVAHAEDSLRITVDGKE